MKAVQMLTLIVCIALLAGCAATQDNVDNEPIEEIVVISDEPVPPSLQITPGSFTEADSVSDEPPHPHDLPLGVWSIWKETDWTFAVDQTRNGDLNYLDREFARLNGLNATFIVRVKANEPLHVEAHHRGLLQPAIALDYAAEQTDSSETIVYDSRLPYDPPRWKSYNDVISRFVYETDLSDSATCRLAHDVLDEIVESHQAAYGDDVRATPFYLVLKEGWERPIPLEDALEFSQLFEYTANKIREYDTERSIIYFGGYSWIARREAFRQDTTSAPTLVDSVFSGKMMRGWNVFNNEIYPFFAKEGKRNWILKNYSGPYYHRNLFINYSYWMRELTRDVERYTEAVNPVGPRPEWWQDIQVQREERIYRDMSHRMFYRRPTTWEYGVQAYLALASGARGITLWPHNSVHFMGEYTDLSGNKTPSDMPMKYPSKGPYAREKQNFHGLIHPSPSSYDDSLAIANYRKPFSAAEHHPDFYSQGLEVEPYPGNHYPYDRIADLFANLHTLLPEVRALRWWWAMDGVDESFIDFAGNNREQRYDHRSIQDQMDDVEIVHDGHPLGQRFRLRAILGEDEAPADDSGTKIASNIYAGMFDNPSDPQWEYYLLVNMTCNAIDGDTVVDATEETVARLKFAGDTPLYAQLVWQDTNRDSRELPGEMLLASQDRMLEVPLLPGDAKLIAIRSK